MTNNLCNNCKHYVGGLTCLAFERIPNQILSGNNDHSKPLKGQNEDYTFEPKE
jgi:hypothetical protein